MWHRKTEVTIHFERKSLQLLSHHLSSYAVDFQKKLLQNSTKKSLTKVVPDTSFSSISALASHRFAEKSRWIVLSFILLFEAKYELISCPMQLSLFGNRISSAEDVFIFRCSAKELDCVLFPHLSMPEYVEVRKIMNGISHSYPSIESSTTCILAMYLRRGWKLLFAMSFLRRSKWMQIQPRQQLFVSCTCLLSQLGWNENDHQLPKNAEQKSTNWW